MGGRAAGVHDPLGDALVVEVGDLLPQVVVLQQHRSARPGLQRVVGVVQPGTLRRRQVGAALGDRPLGARRSAWPVGLTVSGPGLVRLGRQRPTRLGRLGYRR